MTAEADRGKTEARKYNEAKLASLYDECYDKIARYIFVRMGSRAEAEDLAGEVFLKALEALDSYKERGIPMQAWLFRIAHNIVVDHLRKSAKRQTVPIDTVPVVTNLDPVTTVENNIELEKVTAAMKQLTPEQSHVVTLRFFGGLSLSQR